MIRGKKGYDYAILMFIVVMIGLGTLTFVVLEKVAGINKSIGDSQYPLLTIASQKTLITAFVESAAKQAIEKTTAVVAGNSACQILNTQDKPTRTTIPALDTGINSAFNAEMNKYIDVYGPQAKIDLPKSNYELYIEKAKIIGVALKPVNVVLLDQKGSPKGRFFFKPSFELQYEHHLEEYPQIFEFLTEIAKQCSYKTDCAVLKTLPTGWTVEAKPDNKFQFKIPRGTEQACYTLILPIKATPTP